MNIRCQPLWVTESEVVSAIGMTSAIAALERGFELEASARAQNMVKTHTAWEKGTLHAIGAVFAEDGLACTKTWVHTEHGATPLVILFDSRDGSLKAIIEAFALGQLRTGAMSGLATRWLAAPDAADMALIGAGKQAMAQLAAVATVRDLRSVRVFSRSKDKAAAFAERAESELEVPITAVGSVAEAVQGASLITLVTRATTPILRGEMVARGAHINAIGAIVPNRIEFEPSLLDRCEIVAVDNVKQVRNLSREFMDYYGENESAWSRILPLSSVIARQLGRSARADVTLFKATGIGIADLSLAVEIFRCASTTGFGHKFPHPERATVRLRTLQSVRR